MPFFPVPRQLSFRARALAIRIARSLRAVAQVGAAVAAFAINPAAAATTNPTTGDQRLLVLLVNFQDSTLAPFTIEQARDAAFGTVSPFFQTISGGRLRITGDTRGWFTLPIDSTCDSALIEQYGKAAAAAAGIDVASYGRVLFVFAGTATCRSAGFSTITRYPSQTFLNGSISTVLMAHELGHALGLDHATLLDCTSGVIGEGCTTVQDDAFDPMGSSKALVHINAVFKERLGWLGSGDLQLVTGDGDFVLGPYAATTAATPSVLKVYKGPDPASGVPQWYYVEYRQPLDYDAALQANANVMSGVLVRYGVAPQDLWTDASTAQHSTLLDMTPASAVQNYDDRRDPALTAGRTFTDPATGLSITTLWADGATAGVRVKLGSNGAGPATVVVPTNSAPVAVNDAATTGSDQAVTIAVLANDTDPDGDTLRVTSVTQPMRGKALINSSGSITYQPGKRASVSDAFSYTVSDGLSSATATVQITLTTTSGNGGRRAK
jgi:M6 family metalloprotease-like protein